MNSIVVLFLVWFAICPWMTGIKAFEIGHRETSYTDPSRSRTIGVTVYYPADTPGDSVPVADGAFPVMVLGHGFLIGITSYEYIPTGLVPEGYVVILPESEGGISPNHLEFGRDLAFLCDHFQALNSDPVSPFFTHIAPESAIAGHSMGGGAGFLATGLSASVSTLVTFAAAETNPSAIAAAESITIPALIFSGTEDCVTPPESHQILMYDALQSDCKTHITITGASHCQFAQNNSTCRLGEILSGCSATISRDQQESLTIQYILPWLNRFLKHDDAAWSTFQGLLISGSQSGTITFNQDCEPASTPTPDCIHSGDANLSGMLTAEDAQRIFNIVLGYYAPSYQEACAADCDGNGMITAGDSQQTFFAVLGSDECLDPLTK